MCGMTKTEIKKSVKIQQRNFKNATVMKFDNRRVIVEQTDNNDIGLCFKNMPKTEDDLKPSSGHYIVKGKIKKTTIRLSLEAAYCLYHAFVWALAVASKSLINFIASSWSFIIQ